MNENKEDLILDYVNGHLMGEQLVQFEAELIQDPQLLAQVNETKQWQAKVQGSQLDMPTPDFSSIENKIGRQTWRWSYAMPTAASVALVAVLVLNIDSGSNADIYTQPNNQFETLTSNNTAHSVPVLQIVLNDDANTDEFASEYNLNIVNAYPQTQIIDVELSATLKENLQRLEADPRVVFVKQTGIKDE